MILHKRNVSEHVHRQFILRRLDACACACACGAAAILEESFGSDSAMPYMIVQCTGKSLTLISQFPVWTTLRLPM